MKGDTNFKQLAMSVLALLFTLFAGLTAEAHGEDKPGPHGGQIRMPGAFHTEVIAHPNGYQIYLLDINFQNPTVKNSEVKASIKSVGRAEQLKCETHPDHFFCKFSSPPQSGTLTIEPTRESLRGNAAQYNIPF